MLCDHNVYSEVNVSLILTGTVHQEDAAIKMIRGRNSEAELLKEIAVLERAKTHYVVRFLGYSVCPTGVPLSLPSSSSMPSWQSTACQECIIGKVCHHPALL